MIVAFDMKGGIEEMNWEMSPNDVAWRKAINEIAGGAAKATPILDEFSSLVDREVTCIGKSVMAKP